MTDRQTLNRDYFVSVIAVLMNDAPMIEAFVQDLAGVLKSRYENYEILLIDNDSEDQTSTVMRGILAKEDCIRYVKLSSQYSMEAALSAGLEIAIGDVIITMEPECDPPGLLPSFVDKTIATGGVIYGIRLNHDAAMAASYRIGKKIFHVLCKALFEFSPPRSAGFYMGLSRSAVNAIVQIKGKAKFLRVFGRRIGYRTDTIPYAVEPRRPLRRQSLARSVDYGLAVIFTNSTRPLRLISLLGITAAVINLLGVGYILISALVRRSPVGPLSLLALQIAATGVFLFLIIVFLCEHYIRSVENVTDGPTYYIDHELTSSVMVSGEEQRRNVFEASGRS